MQWSSKVPMFFYVVKDKDNSQNHLHKYKRLIQKKRTIMKVTQQFFQTQEKAYAYMLNLGNVLRVMTAYSSWLFYAL